MFKLSSTVLASLILLAGCPKKGGDATTTAPTGGGDTAAAPSAAFGGTMADAPMHELGATVTGTLGCRESLYAKWNLPEGQAAKMTVTVAGPAGSCASISYLKGNGGAVDGMMKELCVDKNASETWDITGQEGGSFIQQTEAVPCQGATITIVAQ